jgi:hypothetical protein
MLHEGPATVFIDGVAMVSNAVTLRIAGGSVSTPVFGGTSFAQTATSSSLTIRAPFFGNATPQQVARMKQKLSAQPCLIVIVFTTLGSTFTTRGMFADRGIDASATDGASEDIDINVEEPLAA